RNCFGSSAGMHWGETDRHHYSRDEAAQCALRDGDYVCRRRYGRCRHFPKPLTTKVHTELGRVYSKAPTPRVCNTNCGRLDFDLPLNLAFPSSIGESSSISVIE